jgi:hypothetical protein
MSKTMAWTVIDRLIVVVHGETEPTDAEWSAYLQVVEAQGVVSTKVLISSAGGSPTRAQRAALHRLIDGRSVPVAVVSSDRQVRALVTVFSWFNNQVKAFPPPRMQAALAFLEVPARRTALIERELHNLHLELVGVLGAP